jgi:hypothetical protein
VGVERSRGCIPSQADTRCSPQKLETRNVVSGRELGENSLNRLGGADILGVSPLRAPDFGGTTAWRRSGRDDRLGLLFPVEVLPGTLKRETRFRGELGENSLNRHGSTHILGISPLLLTRPPRRVPSESVEMTSLRGSFRRWPAGCGGRANLDNVQFLGGLTSAAR